MIAVAAPTGTALAFSRPNRRLLRILDAGFGIAVIVGDTIGSGILRTTGEIAGHLGSYGFILAVWIVGGVYALFCTFSVTELGTMLPFAGGWYVSSSIVHDISSQERPLAPPGVRRVKWMEPEPMHSVENLETPESAKSLPQHPPTLRVEFKFLG